MTKLINSLRNNEGRCSSICFSFVIYLKSKIKKSFCLFGAFYEVMTRFCSRYLGIDIPLTVFTHTRLTIAMRIVYSYSMMRLVFLAFFIVL